MAELHKGQKVQIEFETNNTITGTKTRIDCYISDYEDDRINLHFPKDKEEFIPYLSEGAEIKAFIYTFSGIIVLNSIVFDSPMEEQFTIEYPKDIQVIQRRKYLRMNYKTDFFINLDDENKKTETLDISGGGIRFTLNERLESKKVYKCNVRLEKYDPLLSAEGIILKKSFFKPNEYVIEFTQISEHSRNKIIQKCIALDLEKTKEINFAKKI